MKKLSFLIILFLFSCSDTETSKEQSELNRCIKANISIIENSNTERLMEFPEVSRLPVKIDIDFFKSSILEHENLLEDGIFKKKLMDYSSNKTDEEFIKLLKEEGIIDEFVIINLDDEKISVTPVTDEKKIFILKDFVAGTMSVGHTPETINPIISSTIRLADVDEIAKNICWSQGIY